MSYYIIKDREMKRKVTPTFIIIALLATSIAPALATTNSLEVRNLSSRSNNFSYQQLAEMPQVTEYSELYCYGNIVTSGNWTGVQLSYLLNQTGNILDVNSIQFLASDAYAITVPIEIAISPQTLIAYQKNSEPLAEGLRLILPGYNGAAWIAQIVSISMSTDTVAAPASISIDGSVPRSVLSDFNGENAPAVPKNPAPTASTPTSQIVPTVNPDHLASTNSTQVNPTTKQQVADQPTTHFDQLTVAVTATVLIVGIAISIMARYGRTKMASKPYAN